MRELTVNTFLTLDGIMQAPGGPEEDPEGGFEHGGWSFGYWDEQMQGGHGRVLFEALRSRPRPQDLRDLRGPLAAQRRPRRRGAQQRDQVRGSTTLEELDWQNSNLIEGDVPEGIRALKEGDGPELQVHGSANLIQTLLEHRLIDEFRLMIFPVVLGTGKRLFDAGTLPDGLEVTSSQTSSTGVIMATYRPGAEIKYGSFAPEEPSEAELERRRAQAS